MKERYGGLTFGEIQHTLLTPGNVEKLLKLVNATDVDAEQLAESIVRSNNAKVSVSGIFLGKIFGWDNVCKYRKTH